MPNKEYPEKIELPYVEPAGLIGVHATGCVVSGPGPEGSIQLFFYADAAALRPQFAKRKEGSGANGAPEYDLGPVETYPVREVRARVSLSNSSARELLKVLSDRPELKGEVGGKS